MAEIFLVNEIRAGTINVTEGYLLPTISRKQAWQSSTDYCYH